MIYQKMFKKTKKQTFGVRTFSVCSLICLFTAGRQIFTWTQFSSKIFCRFSSIMILVVFPFFLVLLHFYFGIRMAMIVKVILFLRDSDFLQKSVSWGQIHAHFKEMPPRVCSKTHLILLQFSKSVLSDLCFSFLRVKIWEYNKLRQL